jgi:thioredoxin 1
MIERLNTEDFKKKVFDFEKNSEWKFEGQIPAIVKFTAAWCMPCRILNPILNELSEEYKDRINIYEVDVDDEIKISSVFGIRSIPLMLFCNDKDNPTAITGAVPKSKIIEAIDKYLLV